MALSQMLTSQLDFSRVHRLPQPRRGSVLMQKAVQMSKNPQQSPDIVFTISEYCDKIFSLPQHPTQLQSGTCLTSDALKWFWACPFWCHAFRKKYNLQSGCGYRNIAWKLWQVCIPIAKSAFPCAPWPWIAEKMFDTCPSKHLWSPYLWWIGLKSHGRNK